MGRFSYLANTRLSPISGDPLLPFESRQLSGSYATRADDHNLICEPEPKVGVQAVDTENVSGSVQIGNI